MKLLIIDFNRLLQGIHNDSLHTKTFEIYYDIARMLDISISQEAAFKLYTKYKNNYGKLKDYLCILGPRPDKKHFDEEFMRRYSQVYFHTDLEKLEGIKNHLSQKLGSLSQSYLLILTGTGNVEFMKTALKHLDLVKYFNIIKVGEYYNEYPAYIDTLLQENVLETQLPESIIFSLDEGQEDIAEYIKIKPAYLSYPIQFEDFERLS